MPELIDRQRALSVCKECCLRDDDDFIDGYNTAIKDIREAIKELPTIEPEARRGRWIEKPPYADETVKGLEFQIVCSRCDEQNASINFNDSGEIIGKTFYKTQFCPNCGARMELRTPTEVQLDEADSVMMGDTDQKKRRMETIAITKTGNASIKNAYEARNGNLIGPF